MTSSNQYEAVIGLEVHAQLATKSKLFCADATSFGAAPNTQISPITMGHPGSLPKTNKLAVEYAIKMGLACGCTIVKENYFARKNYFYPDLPKGYQISQHTTPICAGGKVSIQIEGSKRFVQLNRIHLEEDAGKSIHDIDPSHTLIDLNRAGTPLIEIVTEPDLNSAEEAFAYVTEIRKLVQWLGVCDGNMEEGSLRADVNVSVRKVGSKDFGTRCEIKNVNSIKFMQQAIQYEAKRQIELLEEGKKIDQETRLFDTKKNETRQMRSKEDAHDYRYFPDPDLPPLKFDQSFVDGIKQKLPELPDDKKDRLIKDYKLSSYEAGVLISDKDTSDYFEDIAKNSDVKLAINWVIGDLFAALNKIGKSIKDSPISSKNLTKLIDLIKNNTISGRIAKEVFELMINDNRDPKVIVEEKGLIQESNVGELEKIIEKVLKENVDKVTEYKSGKDKLFGFFVGSVIKESKGKANPALVNDILKKKLS